MNFLHTREVSSFWMKLITGKILPLATVMVTSRPWAIKDLIELKHGARVSQHIEVVGFTRENISEYINKAFTDSTKERSFREYLANYPHIHSTMYLPLNCAIVVEVYRLSGSANPGPKTVTQLYSVLVKALLQRYMDSHPEGPTLSTTNCRPSSFLVSWHRRVDVFKYLPSSVYHQLCALGKLAYQGLCNNQQLIFSDLPANFETLDLLQEVPQFYDTGKASSSYNFLHLTVQEFLAAFHILHLGTGAQQKVLKGKVVFMCPTVEEGKAMLGEHSDADSSLLENNEIGCQQVESGLSVVATFVAGLSGLKQCKVYVPRVLFTFNRPQPPPFIV